MFKKGCFELGATIYPAVIKVSHYTSTCLEHATRLGGVGGTCRLLQNEKLVLENHFSV